MSSQQKWNMGEKVEALHKRSNTYRMGKIVAVHKSSGLYDVSFYEGGEELDLSPDMIYQVGFNGNRPAPSSSNQMTYNVGDQVEANREGKEVWRYAVIAKVHADNAYDVVYTDRTRENRVPSKFIRGLYASADQTSSAINKNNIDVFADPDTVDEGLTVDDICLGMIVDARYHGGKQFYTGTISRISKRSNTIDILYEDGDTETFLPLEYIRLIPGKSVLTNNGGNRDSAEASSPREVFENHTLDEEPLFPVGTAVEGNFQGKNRWYPGIVTRIRTLDNGEHRYAVRYKDGDSEDNIPQHLLRMPKLRSVNSSNQAAPDSSSVPNRLSSKNNSSPPSSQPFSDSDSPLKNRKIVNPSTAPAGASRGQTAISESRAYNPIDEVSPSRPHQKRHHKNSNAGVLKQEMLNNHDDDDDDHHVDNFNGNDHDEDNAEPVVSTKLAGDLHISSTPGKTKKHRKHHHRRHNQHSDDDPSSASVSRQNSRNGTPLRGERNVQSNSGLRGDSAVVNGRMLPQELEYDANSKSNSLADKKQGDGGVPINSVRIEANFQGKGVWFPGRLMKERGNGTVDIMYDDGDKELGVPLDRIRPLHNNRPAADPVPSQPAVPVNAVDNNYDRVEKAEQPQQHQHRHQHRKDKKPSLASDFAVGDRVMANFRNQGQFYPGVVKKFHSHGLSVDILYDDGDLEKKIPVDRVQKLDSFSAPNIANAAGNSGKVSAPAAAAASGAKPKGGASIGDLDIGSLVEAQELDGKRTVGNWQVGRILRLYPSQSAADVKLAQPSPHTGQELLIMQPWQFIRPVQKPLHKHQPAATVVAAGAGAAGASDTAPVVAVFPQDSSDQQLQQALALNSNDVVALREYLRRKDAEIERLRQTVTSLTQGDDAGGRRTAPVSSSGGRPAPGRQLVGAASASASASVSASAANGVEDAMLAPHAPRTANSGAAIPRPSRSVNSSRALVGSEEEPTAAAAAAAAVQTSAGPHNLQQLARANEELKRSVAFLGQKFTMVVEELVRVKDHEEKLAKHVKKQGEMIKRLYHERGMNSSLPAVNPHSDV